jgi:hypothetical protein
VPADPAATAAHAILTAAVARQGEWGNCHDTAVTAATIVVIVHKHPC